MQQHVNGKTAGAKQKKNPQHNVKVPKKADAVDVPTREYSPLGNITCSIGDNACAAKHVSVIRRAGLFHPMNESQKARSFLGLQQQYGNRFVQRVVAQHAVQTKLLKMSQPGDIYEQEADQVAEQVMQMSNPQVQRQSQDEEEEEPIQLKPFAGQTTPLVRRQIGQEEVKTLRAKDLPGQTSEATPHLEARIKAMQGGGQTLPPPARAFFEPRFGHAFSQVRVHADGQAAEAARTLNTRAFTVGSDIVFGAGQFVSGSRAGWRVLAHELTHVVQHGGDRNTISFWGGGEHRSITRTAARGIIDDPHFVYMTASASPGMDYKARRLLWTGPRFLLGVEKGEGPDHGEDGNYSITNESAAAAQNIRAQNSYLNQAVRHRQRAESLRTAGEPVRRVGAAAQRMFSALGDACHIAQDRGSHWEGVKGKGHDDPRTQRGWNPDDPSDNPVGHGRAITNTAHLFTRWRSLTSGREE